MANFAANKALQSALALEIMARDSTMARAQDTFKRLEGDITALKRTLHALVDRKPGRREAPNARRARR